MPCLIALLVLLSPRLAIVLLWLFTNFFTGVFETVLIPVLGFLIMPLTLLAYTWLTNYHPAMDGLYWIVIVLAVVLDLGLVGGARKSRWG